MISILRSLNEHVALSCDSAVDKSLECYLAAIQMFRNHAITASAEHLREHRNNLENLHRELSAAPSVRALEDSRKELETEVAAYAAKVEEFHQERELEVKQIISLLTQATGALTERNAKYTGEFRGFAVQLEQTSKCDDLRQIRLQLSQQVEKLKTCADTFCDDNAAALEPLQQELKGFEERLENAERLASTDSLTELFNRREGEKRVQSRIRAGRTFCLLVIDLNRFKWINDRHGHHCGDQVLKLVARTLLDQVRPSDTVCRWGGDEFLIIMECGLKDAMTRSRQIGDRLRGRYPVSISGRRTEVEVSACCGVAGHSAGETLEQVFERADAMLYQIKDKDRAAGVAG